MSTPSVKERPILFSTDMVKAILDGNKTQTRRVMKAQPSGSYNNIIQGNYSDGEEAFLYVAVGQEQADFYKCHYGQKGDVLWVKETWCDMRTASMPDDNGLRYKASTGKNNFTWKSPLFMPKKAARIWLKITNVRVERLKDISAQDAIAEGIKYSNSKAGFCGYDYLSGGYNLMTSAQQSFFYLWKKVHKIDRYAELENPWLWVVEFDVISTSGTPTVKSKEARYA